MFCVQEINLDHHKSVEGLGSDHQLFVSKGSAHGRQGAGLAIRCSTPFQRISIQSDLLAVAVQLFVTMKIVLASLYLTPKDKEGRALLVNYYKKYPSLLYFWGINANHTA